MKLGDILRFYLSLSLLLPLSLSICLSLTCSLALILPIKNSKLRHMCSQSNKFRIGGETQPFPYSYLHTNTSFAHTHTHIFTLIHKLNTSSHTISFPLLHPPHMQLSEISTKDLLELDAISAQHKFYSFSLFKLYYPIHCWFVCRMSRTRPYLFLTKCTFWVKPYSP